MRKAISIALFITYISAIAQTEAPDTVSARQLNEVVVNGEKPQVRGEAGVMVVDLPAIVRDKPVTNVLEALGYMPGVMNNNGMIRLTGASDVTIILNGELTNMPIQNLYRLLYTTPVDRLKNVEIMYSAPAKYHVNGAVINVVLKTPRPIDGLQGQVRTAYNNAHYGSYGAGLAATYAVDDWTFDLNYGLSRNRSWSREETWSDHLHNSRRTMIEDDMRRIARNWCNTVFASAAWKTLRLTYNGQITSDSKTWGLSSGTLGDYTNAYNMLSPVGYHNIALRYAAPSGLTVGGDYTRYSENRSQSLFKETDYLFGSNNLQDINRYHVYLDQQHQLGKWQLTYGAEYQHSRDHSSQHYYPGEMPDFDDILNEEVASLYIGTRRSFDWGLSFDASAKGEYFHNKYQHNWNFIPQFGATYYNTPRSIFQLNLSTQRIYPSYWELHGGTNYINDYSMVIGNPKLQPYIRYDAQFDYILRQKYIATLYFQYGDKATVQLPYQSPDALNLIYQTINTNYKRTVGLNLYAPFGVGYIWNATATANVFNQREKADTFHDISFDNGKWIFYGELSNSFKFSQTCPVSLSVDFSYISPSVQGIADLSGIWRVDAGVKWQFGKKRCCELDLRADDIFNTWSPTMTIDKAGQDYKMKVRDMTRNIRLTFIWRFNGFRPEDTDIDTSRFGMGK
ncbi:MAG: outer membrane beta-barrel family protein [Bacteroidales bacterium]|nr:outer membrane beta-barrel family protein [Bacteroidales bacterium]